MSKDMKHICGSCIPVLRCGVASVEIDGETVIYDVELDATHLLNPTATAVWSCLDGETTVDQLIDDVAAAFGVPREEVRTDILTLLRDLGRAGLLEGGSPKTVREGQL
jgi:PqqD family protein of HPr-rel-A system